MKATDLTRYTADPVRFVSDVFASTNRVLAGYQRVFVQSVAPSVLALRGKQAAPLRRWWVEWTKGSGKDSVLAAVVLWCAAFVPWAIQGQVGAVDQAQADELRKAARDFVRAVPWLAKLITMQRSAILNPRTDAVVEIVPADAPGSHGSRPDLLILNELCHHPCEEFASNMMDNATKVDRNLTIIATNAGAVTHWSFKWRQLAMESDRWSVHLQQQPAPWIGAEELAEAEHRNPPSRFSRLYWGVWASGSGDALSSEWIDRSVVLDGPTRKHPGTGWRTVAGLDAGTRRDFTALVVLGKHVGCYELLGEKPRRLSRMQRLLIDAGEMLPPVVHSPGHLQAWADRSVGSRPGNEYRVVQPTNKLRLLWCKVWKPDGCEVDLELVEREVLRCKRVYKLSRVAFDPWQLTSTAQRLRRQGVRMEATDPTGGNLSAMARELMGGFSDNRIELYNDEGLLRDLRSMSLVERSYGVRVESPRSREHGHADLGTAFCLALFAASRIKGDRMRREGKIISRLREVVGA